METAEQKVIVITGASAGIGRAIALALAHKGSCLGLIARSKSALDKVGKEVEKAGGEALALPCDVTDYTALEEAGKKVEQAFGPIDLWINSVMASVFSKFEDISADEFRRVTDVTYHGYVFGTKVALKSMKPRNRGQIIQIGSALAYRSVPLQSAYCGAKFAIRGFTDALRSELLYQKSDINLSVIHIPAFNTPQFSWSRLHLDKEPQPLPPVYDPALAAEAVLWTIENPQREVWVGWQVWKAILGQKLLPGFLDRYMSGQAWEGQLTDKEPKADRADNLFSTVENKHGVKGPFTDREVTRKPVLWHVRNHNLWINAVALVLLFLAFFVGWITG